MCFLLITDNVMKKWGRGSFGNQCIQIQSNVVKMFVEFEIKLQTFVYCLASCFIIAKI